MLCQLRLYYVWQIQSWSWVSNGMRTPSHGVRALSCLNDYIYLMHETARTERGLPTAETDTVSMTFVAGHSLGCRPYLGVRPACCNWGNIPKTWNKAKLSAMYTSPNKLPSYSHAVQHKRDFQLLISQDSAGLAHAARPCHEKIGPR